MAVHVRNDDGRVLVVYRDKKTNKVKQESFGRGRAALIRAEKRNRELGYGKRSTGVADLPTFLDVAELYLTVKQFSPYAFKNHSNKIFSTISPQIGNIAAESISFDDIDKFVKKRQSDGVKWSSIRRELTEIKAILNFAVKRNPPLIAENPIRDYPMPQNDYDVIDPPTVDEINRILENSKPHLRRFVLLSFYLGARPGAVEILSLTWAGVNLKKQLIRINSADKGGPKTRYVPIHKDLLPQLKRWYLADGKKGPIIHYRGKSIQKIWKGWKSTLKRAGIKRRLRPYDLRHRFVTHALEAGADMKSLSEVVGSRPETLMKHYQHVTTKQHVKTVDLMPVLRPRNTRNTNRKSQLQLTDIKKNKKR